MCRVDDADCVTPIRENHQTARKKHKCFECYREIEPGEVYLAEFFISDGTGTSHKTCAHCEVAREWLRGECGGWIYGQVEDEIREHFFEGYRQVGRLAVGMNKSWKRRDGTLRPLPALPPFDHPVYHQRTA